MLPDRQVELPELFLQGWPTRLKAVFNDLPIDKTDDGDSCCCHCLAGRSDAFVFSLMGSTRGPAVRNLVTFRDDFLGGEMQIGEALTKVGDNPLECFDSTKPFKVEVRATELI